MTDDAPRTISLDDEQVRFVDGLVRSGRFATHREVVQAALQALQRGDDALESWLREDVVPIAAAMMADPSQAIPIDDVFDEIERLHGSRVNTDGGA